MMKLDAQKVQEVRTLSHAGFSASSIARVYEITSRQMWDITRGRAWRFLLSAPVELPLLSQEVTARLKFRSAKRLTPEQKAVLADYINRLAATIEDQDEREAYAASLLRVWTRRRPQSIRKVVVS